MDDIPLPLAQMGIQPLLD